MGSLMRMRHKMRRHQQGRDYNHRQEHQAGDQEPQAQKTMIRVTNAQDQVGDPDEGILNHAQHSDGGDGHKKTAAVICDMSNGFLPIQCDTERMAPTTIQSTKRIAMNWSPLAARRA